MQTMSSSSKMFQESVLYPPRDGYPLYLTAKRYWRGEFLPYVEDPTALTLVFLHATSFHKESWEPTIERIFDWAVKSKGKEDVRIREAWCIDCPNHGESGKYNEVTLLQPEFFLNFTCQRYAEAVHHFFTAGVEHGARVDFMKRRLVGIGHSLGGNAITLLQSHKFLPSLPFQALVLVEPMLSPAGPQHLSKLRTILIKGAYERRDVWPDLTRAFAAFKRRERTALWDPRVVDLFIKHGLRKHPGADWKDAPYDGITLACTRDQEAAMYRDEGGATEPVKVLDWLCATGREVHLVLGGVHDFMPKRTQTALVDPSSGRKFASITRIMEAGHLIVHEKPDRLGDAIFSALVSHARRERSRM